MREAEREAEDFRRQVEAREQAERARKIAACQSSGGEWRDRAAGSYCVPREQVEARKRAIEEMERRRAERERKEAERLEKAGSETSDWRRRRRLGSVGAKRSAAAIRKRIAKWSKRPKCDVEAGTSESDAPS